MGEVGLFLELLAEAAPLDVDHEEDGQKNELDRILICGRHVVVVVSVVVVVGVVVGVVF